MIEIQYCSHCFIKPPLQWWFDKVPILVKLFNQNYVIEHDDSVTSAGDGDKMIAKPLACHECCLRPIFSHQMSIIAQSVLIKAFR